MCCGMVGGVLKLWVGGGEFVCYFSFVVVKGLGLVCVLCMRDMVR